MIFKIAWRNIWRNKTRSLVILLTMAIGIWSAIFLLSFSNGMNNQRVREAIKTEISHFQFHHPDYKKNYDITKVIPDETELVNKIQHDPKVSSFSKRIASIGMISSSNSSKNVKVNGVYPELESSTTQLANDLIEGSYLDGGKNPIVISQKLADDLGIKLHSKVVLTFQDAHLNLVNGGFRVIGIFKTNNRLFDKRNVYVLFDDFQKLLGISGLHEIAVLLKTTDDLDLEVEQYQKSFPKLLIENWKEIMPELQLMIDAFKQMMNIILFIILLCLAFGLINIMLMAVLERQQELGVLMAIGMNKVRIFLMILIETFYLSFSGALIGVLLGILTVQFLQKYGINLSFYGEGLASFGYSNLVYPFLEIKFYYQITFEIVVITILAALYPAFIAVRLNPIKAIQKI